MSSLYKAVITGCAFSIDLAFIYRNACARFGLVIVLYSPHSELHVSNVKTKAPHLQPKRATHSPFLLALSKPNSQRIVLAGKKPPQKMARLRRSTWG